VSAAADATVAGGGRLELGFPAGRAVVVTGGARGIGGATAEVAARAGLTVAVWDVDEDAAVAHAAGLGGGGGRAIGLGVDVSSPDAVTRALDRTVEAVGVPAYLVNNAGPPAASAKVLHEGVEEVMRCIGLVTERWLALDLPEGAAVVNTASIAGNLVAGPVWYSAAKAAVAGWTRALAAAVGPRVRVNAVAPGLTETRRTVGMLDAGWREDLAARAPLRRHGQPAEVAGVVVFLLSPLASYVTGVLVPVDGGLTLHQ
jgi:NAD(P)-dependent dehydrogenase (short-subunit alcohol dehydrogenase family)